MAHKLTQQIDNQTDRHPDSRTDICTDAYRDPYTHRHTNRHRGSNSNPSQPRLCSLPHRLPQLPAPPCLPLARHPQAPKLGKSGPARRFDWLSSLPWFYFPECGFEATREVMRENHFVHWWTSRAHHGNVCNRCVCRKRISMHNRVLPSLSKGGGFKMAFLFFFF